MIMLERERSWFGSEHIRLNYNIKRIFPLAKIKTRLITGYLDAEKVL